MDGPKEFTIKPFQWALENISASGGIKVTLLGAMPWINIPRQYLILCCVCVSIYIYIGRKTYKPSCNTGGFWKVKNNEIQSLLYFSSRALKILVI
ncbi:hypothetical protein NC652_008721 [Populus alba x Populus x berolinensis]|nr:hypothetical protein NC652_008721 [Populus alba x Populus x berolinensis]